MLRNTQLPYFVQTIAFCFMSQFGQMLHWITLTSLQILAVLCFWSNFVGVVSVCAAEVFKWMLAKHQQNTTVSLPSW